MHYKKIEIIGSSHISQESIDAVENAVETDIPFIIAVELDKERMAALLQKERRKPTLKEIWKMGVKGYLFFKFGHWVEQKLGKLVGVKPGSEMKKAYALARKHKLKIAFIDQPIGITLKRLNKALTWKEKFRFGWDILKAAIFRKADPELMFDLKKVPSKKIIKKLLLQVKSRYPNVYRVLIKERNFVLARNLHNLQQKYPDERILAVMGAGHVDDVMSLLKKYDKHQVEEVSFGYSHHT